MAIGAHITHDCAYAVSWGPPFFWISFNLPLGTSTRKEGEGDREGGRERGRERERGEEGREGGRERGRE